MPPKNPFGVLVCLSLGLCLQSMAQPAVTVRITTVQEEDWRRESSQGPAETLRDRLKAQTIVELHGGTKQDGKLVLRTGKEQPIVSEYGFGNDGNEIIAKASDDTWIGTQVVVQQGLMSSDGEEELLDIEITHDIAAPDSKPYQYATAAKGAQRDKYTVAMPRLHRLHWKGELPPDQTERAIASFPSEDDPSTRIVVFFHGDFGQKAPPHEITQTIYRIPELEMIDMMLVKPWNDAAIIAHLEKARTEGRASIVSEVSTLAGRTLTGTLQAGTEHHLPTEMDPDYDLLHQVPASFEAALAGTKLEFKGSAPEESEDVGAPPVNPAEPQDPFSPRPSSGPVPLTSFTWNSWFGAPAPLAVSWPTSWLRVNDPVTHEPTGKAITGFMDWYDHFAQSIVTEFSLPDTAPHVVAVMPPADQAWGMDRKGRWLDVTVVRCLHQVPKVRKKPAKVSPPWRVLGISLESRAALKLLEQRSGKDDSELLSQLMQRVKEKTAHVRICTASAFSASQHTLSSVREHAYPTEMPSIPSSWSMMPIGTRLEGDYWKMDLEQDLAPPARMEWKLALDMPEAVMWEPSRRKIRTHCTTPRNSGTHLCSAVAVPTILAAPDMPAGETLLILVHRDEELDAYYISEKPHVEVETLIFEVPAANADTWEAVKQGDFAAFTASELDAGRAKLSGHALHQQRQGIAAELELAEEQMTATEFDGPNERHGAGRMRPTALMDLKVGTTLETDCSPDVFEQGGSLNFDLRHSIAKPVEPGLAELLKITNSGEKSAPGATHHFSQWREQLTKLKPNELRCLGARKLPGNDTSVHIAYLRIREAR